MRTNRVIYRDARPVVLPENLDSLAADLHGTVRLPINLDWGPTRDYDTETVEGLRALYTAVIHEAMSPEVSPSI